MAGSSSSSFVSNSVSNELKGDIFDVFINVRTRWHKRAKSRTQQRVLGPIVEMARLFTMPVT